MSRILDKKISDALSLGLFAWLALLATLACGYWHVIRIWEPLVAWQGFSPLTYVYEWAHPEIFKNDFPTGIANLDKSAFMHLYKFAFLLGISPEILFPWVVAGEIIAIAAASAYLIRSLFPVGSTTAIVLTVLLFTFSSARTVSLASFSAPAYLGQYYSFADAFRLVAIGCFFRKHWIMSSLWLLAATLCHLTQGAFAGFFLLCCMCVTPRSFLNRKVFIGALIYGVGVGIWLFSQLQFSEVAPALFGQEWLTFARFMNIHWFTALNGEFTRYHSRNFIPLIGFLILFLPTLKVKTLRDRQIAMGIAGILILTAVGLGVSWMGENPTLIRLCFARASDLVIQVGLPFIVVQWLRDFEGKRTAVSILAGVLLLAPWHAIRPYPIALIIPYALLSGRKYWPWALLGMGAVGFYILSGRVTPEDWIAYVGRASPWKWYGAAALLWGVSSLPWKAKKEAWLGIVAFTAISWTSQMRPSLSFLEEARSYYEVQVWAKKNTTPDSLFMTDPTIYYGWRDFSQRSSFGNLREWLHTAWIYSGDKKVFALGMNRFNLFEEPLYPYLSDRYPLDGAARLGQALSRKYAGFSDSWRRKLARDESIDYFVYRKAAAPNETKLKRVFENAHFFVLSASD